MKRIVYIISICIILISAFILTLLVEMKPNTWTVIVGMMLITAILLIYSIPSKIEVSYEKATRRASSKKYF
jgi:surface polysaccharide O-acyltransferase-like enzyme